MQLSIEKLKAELAQQNAKRNQLIGKRDTLLDRLQKEFGLKSFADAEKEIERLDAQVQIEQAEFEKLKKEYENVGTGLAN
jgi:predicted RNase H-like nuclease (RuvC/YqgF family)